LQLFAVAARYFTRAVVAPKEVVFNPAVIRRVCQQLATEKDPQRARELMSLLQTVVEDDQEEVRLRFHFLAKHYKSLLEDEETIKELLENGAA
jgi:hypothetical protein